MPSVSSSMRSAEPVAVASVTAAVVRELGLALGRPPVALERLVHVRGRPLDLDVRRVVLRHLVQLAEDPQGRGQVVRVDHGACGGFGSASESWPAAAGSSEP